MSGNMYDWVTRTWNPVGGECPINCPYCYVKDLKRFPVMAKKYSGDPRPTGPWPKFKAGEVVFVCSCTDLFAMPGHIIEAVLKHCHRFYQAMYVFQTKVPDNYWKGSWNLPPHALFGTTIESDFINDADLGDRIYAIGRMRDYTKTFVTVEPIQKFSRYFADTLITARPSFVNIGADSGNNHLPEPTKDEVLKLIADLRGAGIEVRVKPNLERITGRTT